MSDVLSPSQADLQLNSNCSMVGYRNPRSMLQCNTYLRSFGEGAKKLHWCVDPGSQLDWPHVRANLLTHVEGLDEIQLFSANHQDPDVVGNLRYLVEENDRLSGLITEDAWRLVRHLNASPKKLYFATKFKNNMLKLPGGHRIQVVPTPFCHFRGAVAFYDVETRVLFTGDLFGGLNQPGRIDLHATEEDWSGVAQFHQIYMPGRAAVDYAIRQIRALRPTVEMIAPQHGFVLSGDIMHSFMERLAQLPMGMDLIPYELDEKYLPGYQEIFNSTVHTAALHAGRDSVLSTLRKLDSEHELRQHIRLGKNDVELVSGGIRALPLLVAELSREQFDGFRTALTAHVLERCSELDVPVPQLGAGVAEYGEELGFEAITLGAEA